MVVTTNGRMTELAVSAADVSVTQCWVIKVASQEQYGLHCGFDNLAICKCGKLTAVLWHSSIHPS